MSKLKLRWRNFSKSIPIAAVIIVFGGLGTALLLTSHAATPTASVEAESGTVSSQASSVNDSTASGNLAVKFGTPTQTTNCLPNPHLCGFPDATNTGVPSGTTLTAYTGPTTITTAGTTIDSKLIHGPVTVQAANVTIKNSLIYMDSTNVSGQNVGLWIRSGANSFLVSHTEVTGMYNGQQSYCISALANDATGATIDTVNMHDCGDGVRGGDLTATNNYIHAFWYGLINGAAIDTPHADCFQGLQGDSNAIIRHNTCNNPNSAPPPGSPGYSNSVIQLGSEGGIPATNWTVDNNLFQGGGFSVNMRQTLLTGMSFTNNHWGRDNAYGLIGSTTGDSYSWSGNVWDDTGLTATASPG